MAAAKEAVARVAVAAAKVAEGWEAAERVEAVRVVATAEETAEAATVVATAAEMAEVAKG